MAVQLIDKVAGAFTATWNGQNIGATREGFEIIHIPHRQPVIVDTMGMVPVDSVLLGMEVLVRLDWIDYLKIGDPKNGVVGAKALFAAQYPNLMGSLDTVGHFDSEFNRPLVLTAVAGTTAALEAQTWTFYKTIVESDIGVLLSSKCRQGPCTFRVYPQPTTESTGSSFPSNSFYTRN